MYLTLDGLGSWNTVTEHVLIYLACHICSFPCVPFRMSRLQNVSSCLAFRVSHASTSQAEVPLKPTLVAAAGFDATADALNLRDAMKGLGELRLAGGCVRVKLGIV